MMARMLEKEREMVTHYNIGNEEAGRVLNIASKSHPICYGARVWTLDPEPMFGTFICVFRERDGGDVLSARIYWD